MTVSTLDEIIAETPAIEKFLQDAGALGKAYETATAGKSGMSIVLALPALLPQAQALEADFVTIYNSIKAMGAAEAVAVPPSVTQ